MKKRLVRGICAFAALASVVGTAVPASAATIILTPHHTPTYDYDLKAYQPLNMDGTPSQRWLDRAATSIYGESGWITWNTDDPFYYPEV